MDDSQGYFGLIDPQELGDDLWTQIEPYLAKALEHGIRDLTTTDLFESIKIGEYLLFVGGKEKTIEISAVARVVYYKKYKVIRLVAIGGKNFKKYKKILAANLVAVGKIFECKRIEWSGRIGWAKIWPEYCLHNIRLFSVEIGDYDVTP